MAPSPLRKGERNMSENKTAVKVGIMSAKDGSIKVVIFSAPPLGAKAVRVRVRSSPLSFQHAPHSPSRRATRMTL